METHKVEHKPASARGLKKYLTITVGGHTFGVDLVRVTEALECGRINPIPLAGSVIRGVINIRGTIVPIIDLGVRFYNTPIAIGAQSCIVLFDMFYGGTVVVIGALADRTQSVVSIDPDLTEPPPDFGATIPERYIGGIGHAGEERLLLLDVDTVLQIDELSSMVVQEAEFARHLASLAPVEKKGTMRAGAKAQQETPPATRGLVTFYLDRDLYAVDLDRVRELADSADATRLPNTLPFMKGVIDIGGSPVPVIDLRARCGLAAEADTHLASVLVVEHRERLIGLIIESFPKTMYVPLDAIREDAHYAVEVKRDFIEGIARVNDRFVVILDVEKILTLEEYDGVYGG